MNPAGKPEGLRVAMAWFHTWAGLLLGWLMFAIFLTGTLSFYRHELTQWLRPGLHSLQTPQGEALDLAIARGIAAMPALAPKATQWTLRAPDARDPVMRVSWRENGPDGARFETRALDPASGSLLALPQGMAGDFFYRFHFELRSADKSKWIMEGRWAVCIASLLMFAALISGVITHRRLFADFFTLRWRKGGQRAWLDGHNLMGVLVLPFYLLISFSGLVIFHAMLVPAALLASYGSEARAYLSELQGAPAVVGKVATGALPAADWARILPQAQQRFGAGGIDAITLRRDGEALRVEVRASDALRITTPAERLLFDARTGELIGHLNPPRAAAQTVGLLSGLHTARFASPGLRFALFGLGLAGSLMIATGLVLWTVKRESRQCLGWRMVRGLNIGTLAGLPLAVAVFALASLLLPVDIAQRADAEIQAFYITWGLALAWGLAAPSRSSWARLWMLNALAFAALLLAGLGLAGPGRALAVWAVDAGWLLAALASGLLAWRLRAPAERRHLLAAGQRA